MNIKLPVIGDIHVGKKADPEVVEVIKEVKEKTKAVMGGFLDFGSKPLTDEVSISSKLLEANKGWVYRNNDAIASEVGGIEFELYTVKTVRNEVIYDQIFSSPILDALDKFNEFTSSSDGFYITQSHRKLAGDAFWYIDKTGTTVNGIYILPPDKVKINLGKVAGSQRVIQSYEYRDTINGETISVTYEPEQIIHFKVPNPSNYYRGKSAVEAAATAIDTDNLAIEANMKLFQRGLIANFILTTEKSLTPEQLKQLHSEFRNTYGGVENAYKVPIIGGGLEPKNLQMSNKDAQYLEQQEWLRDKICAMFGNPKSIITTDDVNRSNADSTILNWKRTTVRSNMKAICDTLNEFFVPMYGKSLILGFKDPVEEDENEEIDQVIKLRQADIITLNEARAELDLEPVKGGDEHNFQRVQSGVMIENVPKSLLYVKRKSVLRTSGAYKSIDQFVKTKQAAKPFAKQLIKEKKVEPKVKYKSFSAERAEIYYNKQIKIVSTAEKIFEDKVSSFINFMVDKALAAVPAEFQDMQKKQLWNEEELLVKAELDFTPILMEVAMAAGTEAINLINADIPYIPVNIRKQVERQVKTFTTSMIETDQEKIIDAIATGVQNGQSVPEISNTIRADFAEYNKVQTMRITRTEVLKTSSYASIDAWKQTDVVVGKEWLVAPGADAECEQYNGKIVALDGKFYDTNKFTTGNPPVHPNCRCVLLPVLKGERANKVTLHNKALESENAELKEYIKELEGFINEEA